MNDEIKVNDYVRTIYGQIFKVKEIKNNSIFTQEKDKDFGFNYILTKEDITKHSPNIIDLIEIGDYVNGHKIVNEIYGEDDNNLYFEIEGGFNKAKYIGEEDIKSIVTKEQFEQIMYRVEE